MDQYDDYFPVPPKRVHLDCLPKGELGRLRAELERLRTELEQAKKERQMYYNALYRRGVDETAT